jgi:hypothetical protein
VGTGRASGPGPASPKLSGGGLAPSWLGLSGEGPRDVESRAGERERDGDGDGDGDRDLNLEFRRIGLSGGGLLDLYPSSFLARRFSYPSQENLLDSRMPRALAADGLRTMKSRLDTGERGREMEERPRSVRSGSFIFALNGWIYFSTTR